MFFMNDSLEKVSTDELLSKESEIKKEILFLNNERKHLVSSDFSSKLKILDNRLNSILVEIERRGDRRA